MNDSSLDKLKKKLQNALKLNGFVVRRDLCNVLVERFLKEHIDLRDNDTFESNIKSLCDSLEKQCLNDKSIELEHVQQALEACLHSGCDKNETVFNVINAFDFPKLHYDLDRKLYLPSSEKKPMLLSDADSKANMFTDRYITILHRTERNFRNKLSENENERLTLQTVDYLLTVSYETLDRTLILGSLIQIAEGKYYLEDRTGIVQLDLTHAKYHGGFFPENCFVLVNGFYEDKILRVSTIVLPPGEEYKDSKPSFGGINYFGGPSTISLRESAKLKEYMFRNPQMIFFFSDVWLNHPLIFEKLEILFEGMQASPPLAFVFMGNFMSETPGCEGITTLRKLFKQFGELAGRYVNLVNNSHFVFVPGMTDPCIPHIVPRLSLPNCITEEITKHIPKATFATNPCRLQYCTREIVIFRADILTKLMQSTLHKPGKDEIASALARTIISQGHLSPLSLNALTVHWDFDYTLRLYPLPDLVVIGDKTEAYEGKYKGCQVINPGSLCETGFQFKCYTPHSDSVDDCAL